MDESHNFLILTSYYRKFVPLFVDFTKHLSKPLKNGTRFQWSAECQSDIKHFKKLFVKNLSYSPLT